MKNLVVAIFIVGVVFFIFGFVFAQEKEVEINFFYSKTCPYCAKEKIFLEELEQKYPEIEIIRFDISKTESIELLKKFYQEYEVPKEEWGLVPITFINKDYFLGFNDKIAKEIESFIGENITELSQPVEKQLDITKYSLPVLAVILGTLDGFNVCSLGALILILGLVLAFRSRKKILLFGGLFILTTAIIYGFLIFLWYQIFSFLLPYLRIMQILIGLLGILGGIYFLRQFIKFKKQGPTCDVGWEKGVIARFQKTFKNSGNILLLLASVLIFAVIITIVEFPCSAALPVVFAGVLAKANLLEIYYFFYISLYLLFYMLDEIIVFLVAIFTMKLWLASPKAITWITLAQALILFFLGAYYLFGFSILI